MYIVYGKRNCSFCTRAKQLLEERGEVFTYVDVEEEGLVEWLKEQGHRTVPQVYREVDAGVWEPVGGYQELAKSVQ